MNKICLLFITSLAMALTLFLAGCSTDVEEETQGQQAPVLDYVPSFDINNLPSPAEWSSKGHMHTFPDLFTFADGSKVRTLADWDLRRKEIVKIIQYYEYGVMPSLGSAAEQAQEKGVLITFVNSGNANTSFTVTNGRRVFNFTINTTLPGSPSDSDKGHLGLYFDSSGTNWNGGTASFPLATFARESDGAGEVQTLFSIKVADGSAPSANVSYAWGMSVILTAMEGIDLDGDGSLGVDANGNITDVAEYEREHAFKGWYDPRKVGITGYSRNGKAAECIAAFAESRGGIRVGHVSIGSAGSGGPALERFLSPAGYYLNGLPADPLPPDAPGLMEFNSLIGKPWYMKKTNTGDTTIDGPSVIASNGGTADEWRYKAVRGWSPYFESYGLTPTNYGQASTPFVGWQNPPGVGAGSWSGIQSLSEGRNETPGWFSPRFQEFTDLHMGLDIDHVVGNNDRGKYGILCTIPFDQHFLSALIAPNGILFQDGFVVPRNNPEAQFANWLMIDEIYKFYGEQEGDPEKYIWRNGAMFGWGTHGGNTGNETPDRNYHASKVFADYDKKSNKSFYNTYSGAADLTTAVAKSDYNIFKFRDPLYPIDDPIGRFDYYRANWGRPRAGGNQTPTIAERVQKRIPDALLADYEAGEKTRPKPSYQTSLPAHPSYTPTGPKFKPMDWRGLIDDPEPASE